MASTAVVDRWAGGGPSRRPLALIDATDDTNDRRCGTYLWQFLELRVFSYVPSRGLPREHHAATPGRTSLAAHQQPETTAVFKPAPKKKQSSA